MSADYSPDMVMSLLAVGTPKGETVSTQQFTIPADVCSRCFAVVADLPAHFKWHDAFLGLLELLDD